LKARKYKQDDWLTVKSWYARRNVPCIAGRHLPKVGFIVPGVAAGFLVQTDGGFAMIEHLVGNPEVPDWQRSNGLDAVVSKLCEHGVKLGYSRILGITRLGVVKQRAIRHGFAAFGSYEILVKGD
jgi:hypothetical protein